MVTFVAIILKFGKMGEKTGWTYVNIPADVAQQLKPGNRKSFRVRGKLDHYAIAGVAIMPMGNGNYILTLNADMRKGIHKHEGAMLQVSLEEDVDFKLIVPDDLSECLADEPEALNFFNNLLESHRRYFVNWLNIAKTIETRAKRIAMICHAMSNRMNYPEMIKAAKNPS